MKHLLFSLLLLLKLISFAQLEQINLHQNWEFRQVGTEKWYMAQVPGTVHTDLLANTLIEDPFKAGQEEKLKWIEYEDWEYRTSFEVSPDLAQMENIELVCDGLDTYATIYINDQIAGYSSNMFLQQQIPIKALLKSGKNDLRIVFQSPINKKKDEALKSGHQLPAGSEKEEVNVSPYVRKAAYQFGWDFAPRFVGCGIWRPIYIRAWNSVRIADVHVQQKELTKSRAIVNLAIELDGTNPKGTYLLKCDDLEQKVNYKSTSDTLNLTLEINNPELWYPNGYGDQKIYTKTISLYKGKKLIDQKEVRFGLREIELINQKDEFGTSFYFKVNGEDVFCKGANYIPQDVFLPRVKDKQYRKLLIQAKEANMNMIRVWGGGVYEKDLFYDLCDSLGLMVWQDFMFAGTVYPPTYQFRNQVADEVRYNIKRLRNHPSLAIWCGNNEIEVAWHNWGWQKQYNYSQKDSVELWNNYKLIFHEMIPQFIQQLDSQRPYTPTSPLSNWGTAENFKHSSMHYWGVWHGGDPLEAYHDNVGRFMVEYGFQSYASYELLAQYLGDDLTLNAKSVLDRQKSYVGNSMIEQNIQKYYGSIDNFKDWIIANQNVQAYAMKQAIQAHRKSSGYCMGSLLWQLNDCWPGVSWSIIDHSGQPKNAYSEVQKQFSPVIVVVDSLDDEIHFTALSDKSEAFKGELKVSLVDFNSNETLRDFKTSLSLDQHEPKMVLSIKKDKLPKGFTPNSAYLSYQIQTQKSEEVIFSDFFFFCPPKNRPIQFD